MSKTTPKKVSHTCTQGGPARCLEHLGASGSDPETRGRPWESLGDFRTCGSFQEPLGSSGSLWELLEASGSDSETWGRPRESLRASGLLLLLLVAAVAPAVAAI